ncbi:nitrogen regulation protein NR(II) [Candidatus Lokiarchaeum ossiferum]|uniref:nitrogen regulation protein NR(II) n=1 Tax=Candidatus Lokiarchaeum ossiferum TaxID=2951803 RepID=UPI00352D34D0
MQHHLESLDNSFACEFNYISGQFNLLIESLELFNLINTNTGHLNYPLYHSILEELFLRVSANYPILTQIRYLNATGFEVARIDNMADGKGPFVISSFQDKSDRYYFQDAIDLQKGEIYYSNTDLNIENHLIQTPLLPMLRIASPVFNRNETKCGILIININLNLFLDALATLPENNRIFIIDEAGYFLKNSINPSQEWGQDFNFNNSQWNLEQSNPELFSQLTNEDFPPHSTKKIQLSFTETLLTMCFLFGNNHKVPKWYVIISPESRIPLSDNHFGNFLDISLIILWGVSILLFSIILTKWKKAEKRLILSKELLDEKVKQRTEDLSQLNIRLQQEICDKERAEEILIHHQSLESLALLAGGIAHDFNNYLTAAFGNLTLAQVNLSKENEIYELIDNALNALRRSENLTQKLMVFTKEGVPVKLVVSLPELLIETANFVLSGSNVKITYDFNEDIWPIELDANQISQVINNLVLNAKQAMLSGGKIHVQTRNYIKTSQSFLPLAAEKLVRIRIQDDGPGISRENLKQLFVPYFTTKKTGTGLGLANCFKIIRDHDGIIEVESEVGIGTTFIIYLPALSTHSFQVIKGVD